MEEPALAAPKGDNVLPPRRTDVGPSPEGRLDGDVSNGGSSGVEEGPTFCK